MDLEKIIGRPGCEDLAKLVAGWRRVSERQKGREVKVPLPNYYLNADDGFDFEGIFEFLADELERLELMEFDGPRRVYSFFLKYSAPDVATFDSFRRLYDVIEHDLSRFGHPYGGILVIDITEWSELNRTGEAKFVDFLSYMDTIDDRTMAVFLDRSGSFSTDETYRRLDMGMRIERLHLAFKDAGLGLERLEEELEIYGFKLEKDFREKLKASIDIVINSPSHDGEEAVRQMAIDMVYAALKAEEEVGNVLDAKNSKDFLPDGEWIKTFGFKSRKKLGLVGEGK